MGMQCFPSKKKLNFKILFNCISGFAHPISISKFRSNSVRELAQLTQYSVHEFNFRVVTNERKKLRHADIKDSCFWRVLYVLPLTVITNVMGLYASCTGQMHSYYDIFTTRTKGGRALSGHLQSHWTSDPSWSDRRARNLPPSDAALRSVLYQPLPPPPKKKPGPYLVTPTISIKVYFQSSKRTYSVKLWFQSVVQSL